MFCHSFIGITPATFAQPYMDAIKKTRTKRIMEFPRLWVRKCLHCGIGKK